MYSRITAAACKIIKKSTWLATRNRIYMIVYGYINASFNVTLVSLTSCPRQRVAAADAGTSRHCWCQPVFSLLDIWVSPWRSLQQAVQDAASVVLLSPLLLLLLLSFPQLLAPVRAHVVDVVLCFRHRVPQPLHGEPCKTHNCRVLDQGEIRFW